MIVYGATLSPFVRKLMAFAAEKGIELTLENVTLGRATPEFQQASPFRKMPGFRDPGADNGKDFLLSDSTAIIAYLEAKFPEPNMIPTAPIARARTIWFEEFGDTMVCASGGKMFFNRLVAPRLLKREGDEAAASAAETKELPPLIDYLESVIPDSGFLVEDRITLADIAVASPFANLGHIDVVIDPALHPKAAAYIEAILARPSFAPMVAGERAMLAAIG